jgi:ATP-dependent protease HslVU (ClpYQ) peptidase subunit
MTTITIVRKNNELAIAADTHTKYSYTKEGADYIVNHAKIFRVGDSYVGVAGSATVALAIQDYFDRQPKPPQLDSVMRIFRAWNELHRMLRDEYYLNPSKDSDDSVETSRARALIANANGIFGVDSYRYVQEFTRFYAHGSGNEFALGAIYAAYDSGMTAEQLARLGVEAAAEFDDSTGLPVRSYAIRERRRRVRT